MAPSFTTARAERERKVKTICSFASSIAKRFAKPHGQALVDELEAKIHFLPLTASSAVTAKREELEGLAIELWNLATRSRRDQSSAEGEHGNHAVGLLRVFSFLLLDSAGGQSAKSKERKNCIRLMKLALKAGRWCIENKAVDNATKVLVRAADYQEVLGLEGEVDEGAEYELGERLCVEYFALRTALAWISDRMDIAEHMFTKCKELSKFYTASLVEKIADLFYEIGNDLLDRHNYESAVQWFERAYDVLGAQEFDPLSAEAGELRLSLMQSIIQAYVKLKSEEGRSKAWHMLQLLETDYANKMSVSLLKLEMLFSEGTVDANQVYLVLKRMVHSIVLNERNFKTIMHHIHKLKDHNNVTACKVIDSLIETRLFREEKEAWTEKAIVTRVWISCTTFMTEGTVDQLRDLFDMVLRNIKVPFSPQATHGTQTLLWKQVEANFSKGQHQEAEAWCGICLHPLLDKAGESNKSKIARKMILCALARHDHAAAREIFSKMSDPGKDDRLTRYLMYKAALQGNDSDLAIESLDVICRQSSNDTTLLYACVVEAQQSGNKRQGITALEKLLEKYNATAPTDVHLPALLRMTVRLLMSELFNDGSINQDVFEQVCKTFEAASTHAKASQRRPSNASREQFTNEEFQWFCKNTYNIAVKYCAEVPLQNLVRILEACIEFTKLLQEGGQSSNETDIHLRLLFCYYLMTCTFVTLARAEDNKESYYQHYFQACKYGREFRTLGSRVINKLSESSQSDMIAKHFQIVKLELEAALKRGQWEELDELFEECWKYGVTAYYDTLADLVLVIYTCMSKEDVDRKYQSNVLCALQKIINASAKSTTFEIAKMSRWIRCLFQLALTYDETVSLKCLDHAIRIASARKGDTKHYPSTELEWLATTSFNHAVDYYVQENDSLCRMWAEKALTLAEWAEDGDELKTVLMEKYKGLAWSNES